MRGNDCQLLVQILSVGGGIKYCTSLRTTGDKILPPYFFIPKMESVTPKRRLISTNLHDVTTQKTGTYSTFSSLILFQYLNII